MKWARKALYVAIIDILVLKKPSIANIVQSAGAASLQRGKTPTQRVSWYDTKKYDGTIYQPLRSSRIWLKVNFFKAEFNRFEFRVFLLLD